MWALEHFHTVFFDQTAPPTLPSHSSPSKHKNASHGAGLFFLGLFSPFLSVRVIISRDLMKAIEQVNSVLIETHTPHGLLGTRVIFFAVQIRP